MNLQLDVEVNIYLDKEIIAILKEVMNITKKYRKIMIFTLFSSLPFAFHNFFSCMPF